MTTCGKNAHCAASSLGPGRRVRGVTLVEMLVVVAVTGGLVGLLLPAVQQARESSRRSQCLNNLRQIGIGFHNHHAARDCFPTSVSGGGATHYWAAQILPFVDENPLAGIYDYKVGWNNVNNREAVQTLVRFMSCLSTPGGPLQHPKFKTGNPSWAGAAADYAGSTGPSSRLWTVAPATISSAQPAITDGFFKGSVKPGARGRSLKNITDGSSKTVAVYESAARPQVWAFGGMSPDSGLVSSPTAKYVNFCGWADSNSFDVSGFESVGPGVYKEPGPVMVNGSNSAVGSIGGGARGGIYAFHPAGANLLFADGSTRFVDDIVGAHVVAAMLTAQGQESFTLP
jgi:prepilin-type processing-associated H-X9-DG protein